MAHRRFEPPNKKIPNPPVVGGRRHSENKSKPVKLPLLPAPRPKNLKISNEHYVKNGCELGTRIEAGFLTKCEVYVAVLTF